MPPEPIRRLHLAGNSKNILPSYKTVTSGDMSADITGTPTNIQYLDNICIQCVFTGSPVGTLIVQGSATYQQNPTTHVQTVAGTWSTLTSYAVTTAGDVLFDLNQLSFPWVRVIYTFTSGTGTLNATVSGKAV